MAIDEVFLNPTVEKVIFQIRFSNLFYIENKIGELQIKLMSEFPDSSIVMRRQMVLIEKGDKTKLEVDFQDSEENFVQKIWQFKSPKGYNLNILSNSLDITSEFHKTYSNPNGDHRFRDIIEIVVSNFIKLTNLPIFKRIGLRYIDKCPLISKDNIIFKNWYNSTFPLERFSLDNSEEMMFRVITKKNNYYLRYIESLQKDEQGDHLILDFDGFTNDILSTEYLTKLDALHNFISEEYERSIKEPVYEYMRSKPEDKK
jgi:uncharacterized protein (TIGR04255 family)